MTLALVAEPNRLKNRICWQCENAPPHLGRAGVQSAKFKALSEARGWFGWRAKRLQCTRLGIARDFPRFRSPHKQFQNVAPVDLKFG
jgi:hypothetical protein